MATVIDDLLVRLGFDADTSGAASFDSGLGKIIKTAGHVGAVLGGMSLAVTGALAKVAIDSAEAADETQRFADIAGVTTKELQLMTAGASRYGVEQDKLTDILKDFGDKTGDYIAGEGGAMKDFMENIGKEAGLTAKSFKGLSSADGLQLYVDTLEGANLSQAEMIFYMEGIASDATLLLPLLKDGGKGFKEWGNEAQKAGKIMSDTDLAASKDMLDSIEKAKYIYSGLLAQLSKKVTPYINKALQWVIDNEDQLRAAADELAAGFDLVITSIGDAYNLIGDKIQWIKDNSQEIIDKMKIISGIAGVIGLALTAMYAPAILGFIVLRATALTSFLMMKAAAITSAIATGAAWLIAFAPFLLIGAVIAVVIGLLWTIYNNWAAISAGISAEWGKLTAFVMSYINQAVEWVNGKVQSISEAFSSVAGAISDIWSGLWEGVKSMASGAIQFVIDKVQSLITLISGALGSITKIGNFKMPSFSVPKMFSDGGKGGSRSYDNSVKQSIKVSSIAEAISFSKATLQDRRVRNNGVLQ